MYTELCRSSFLLCDIYILNTTWFHLPQEEEEAEVQEVYLACRVYVRVLHGVNHIGIFLHELIAYKDCMCRFMQTFLLFLPMAVGWKWECVSDFHWWAWLQMMIFVVSAVSYWALTNIHSGISCESARTFSCFCFDASRTGGKFCCIVGLCLCAHEHNLDMFSVWLCYARSEGTLWLDREDMSFFFL